MKFTLEIELGNDAMQTYADIARALKTAIRDGKPTDYLGGLDTHRAPVATDYNIIRDANGNTIGRWEVIDDQAPADTLPRIVAATRAHFAGKTAATEKELRTAVAEYVNADELRTRSDRRR